MEARRRRIPKRIRTHLSADIMLYRERLAREAAERRAEEERHRADRERQRADEERRRFFEECRRADEERRRADNERRFLIDCILKLTAPSNRRQAKADSETK